ncbi:MAG: hypothetical protein NTZ72_13960 [Afipia sp.]|nr:hypothetical protein [Afipia sp.]
MLGVILKHSCGARTRAAWHLIVVSGSLRPFFQHQKPQTQEAAVAKDNAKRTLKKADVLRATEMPLTTFQHWMDRRVISLNGDDTEAKAQGSARRFSQRTIFKLAIAHRIAKLGIPANTAVMLASKFTDEPQRGRELGKPFETGKTIIVAGDRKNGRVVNVQAEEDITSQFREATLIIDVGQIVTKVIERMPK